MKPLHSFFLLLVFTFGFAEQRIYATYSVVPVQQSTLVLQASGVVETILVDVGDYVQEGALLLALRDKEQKAQVAIARAQLQALRAKHEFARLQLERYEKSASVIDGNTLDKIRLETQSLASELARAESALLLQEELLDNLTLKAPFAGVISKKSTEVGNGVVALNSPLFELQSNAKKLVIEFDSSHFGKVATGDVFFYNPSQSLMITKVYPSVDSGSRKAKVEALAPDLPLASGAFGDGFIEKRKP